MILRFFQVEATVSTTFLSDCKESYAFNYMTDSIGTTIFNYLGFQESHSYIVRENNIESIVKFTLPSEKGLSKIIHFNFIYNNYFKII